MKRILFPFLIIFLLSSCLDQAIDKRKIIISNKSKNIVYCLKSQSDSFTKPYIYYKKEIIEELYKIGINSSITLYDNPQSWDFYIKTSEGGKMRLFIVSQDTINKYGWNTVLTKNKHTYVHMVDINDLEINGWNIVYKGE